MRGLKKVSLFLLSFMLVMGIFAQTSRTNEATMGTFTTDVDNFMSVNDFDDVKFDKFFTYANLSTTKLAFGFATKFNNIYLGTNYIGNLYYDLNSTSTQTDTTFTETKGNDSINSISVLLGLSQMGFKLDVDLNPDTTTTTTTNNTTDTTSTSTTSSSSSSFALTWGGLDINLSSLVLKPIASVSFGIIDYSTVSKTVNTTTIVNQEDKGTSYNQLVLAVGAGLDFEEKDSFASSIGLTYAGSFDLYGTGVLDKTVTTVTLAGSTTTQIETTSYSGRALSTQVIVPSYSCTYNLSDALTIKGLFNIPLSFITQNGGSTEEQTTVDGVVSGTPTTTTYNSRFGINIMPNLTAGLRYQIKPNEFAWNFGVSTILPSIIYNSITSGSTNTENTITTSFTCGLGTGFTWILNPEFTVDVSLATDINPQLFTDVIDGSLSIGVTLKK